MNPYDHRTRPNDHIHFYVTVDLDFALHGHDYENHRFDTLDEAMAKYRELPESYTAALGMHIPGHNELDLLQRREGDNVFVADYLRYANWRTSPDVLNAVETLCQGFHIEWQYDSKLLGTLIQVPLEYHNGFVPDPAFNDKMLCPRQPLRYGQTANPITAINEGFLPGGVGWTDFETLHAEAEKFGYHNPHCVKVNFFNINYTDSNGHTGQADILPGDLRVLLDRYTLQYGEPEAVKKIIDRLADEISELMVIPGAERDAYAKTLREELNAGRTENAVASLEAMRDYGDSEQNRKAATWLLARCIGLDARQKSLLPDLCYTVMKTTGELVVLKNGEEGCFRTSYNTPDPAKNKELADYLNAKLDVTPAQVQAMEVGSMFGWHLPGADPRNYERKPLDQQISGAETRRNPTSHKSTSPQKDDKAR